jgi:carbamoylphosphate synthase large subunit
MNNRPTAIVLGGTTPHITLIEKLKQRGYYTILIDYFDNPPAGAFADKHIKESTLDYEKVLEIARSNNASLVITTCLDQANVTACYVAEKLNLPKPYSFETALYVTNKELMKTKMLESNIPTSKFIIAENSANLDIQDLKFPLVVKPADSNGSKGVRKSDNLTELKVYIEDALRFSRTKKVIIEEYIQGMEVQVDCFVQNKIVNIVMMRQRLKIMNQEKTYLQTYGSVIPLELSTKVNNKLVQIANNIAHSFELDNTPLFIQALVNNDEVSVIEFAPRVGGGLSFKLINEVTGFDILDSTIDSYLGIKTNFVIHPIKAYYLTNIIYAKPGIFNSITGYEELIKDSVIQDIYFYKTKGMEIGPDMASSDRIGAFIIKDKDKNKLVEKLEIAIRKLEVYDINNNPIMRKDFFEEISKSM